MGHLFFRITDTVENTHRNVCVSDRRELPPLKEEEKAEPIYFARGAAPISFTSRFEELLVEGGFWNLFIVVFQVALAIYCLFDIAEKKAQAQKHLDNLLTPQLTSPEAFFALMETANGIMGHNPEITQSIKRSRVLIQSALEPERDKECVAQSLVDEFREPGEKYLPTGYYVGSRFVPIILGIEYEEVKGSYTIKEYSLSPQTLDFKKTLYKQYELDSKQLLPFLNSLALLSHPGKDNQQRSDKVKNTAAFIRRFAIGGEVERKSPPKEEAPKAKGAIIETLIVSLEGKVDVEAMEAKDLRTLKPSSDPVSLILQCPLFNADEKPVFFQHLLNHVLNCVLEHEAILDGKKKDLYLHAICQKIDELGKKLEKSYGREAATLICQEFKDKLPKKAEEALQNVVRRQEEERKTAFGKWVSNKEMRLRYPTPKKEESIQHSSVPEIKIHEVPGFTELKERFSLAALRKLCIAANECLGVEETEAEEKERKARGEPPKEIKREYLNAWKIASHTLHVLPSIENVDELIANHTDDELNEISLRLEQITHYLMEAKLKLGQVRMHTNEVLDTMNCSALLISIMRSRIVKLGVNENAVEEIHDRILAVGPGALQEPGVRARLQELGIPQSLASEMEQNIHTLQKPFLDAMEKEFALLEGRHPYTSTIHKELGITIDREKLLEIARNSGNRRLVDVANNYIDLKPRLEAKKREVYAACAQLEDIEYADISPLLAELSGLARLDVVDQILDNNFPLRGIKDKVKEYVTLKNQAKRILLFLLHPEALQLRMPEDQIAELFQMCPLFAELPLEIRTRLLGLSQDTLHLLSGFPFEHVDKLEKVSRLSPEIQTLLQELPLELFSLIRELPKEIVPHIPRLLPILARPNPSHNEIVNVIGLDGAFSLMNFQYRFQRISHQLQNLLPRILSDADILIPILRTLPAEMLRFLPRAREIEAFLHQFSEGLRSTLPQILSPLIRLYPSLAQIRPILMQEAAPISPFAEALGSQVNVARIHEMAKKIKETGGDTKYLEQTVRQYELDKIAEEHLKEEVKKPFTPEVLKAVLKDLYALRLEDSLIRGRIEIYKSAEEFEKVFARNTLEKDLKKLAKLWNLANGEDNPAFSLCSLEISQNNKDKNLSEEDRKTQNSRAIAELQKTLRELLATIPSLQEREAEIRREILSLQMKEAAREKIADSVDRFQKESVENIDEQIKGLGIASPFPLENFTYFSIEPHDVAWVRNIRPLGIKLERPYVRGMAARAMGLSKDQAMLLSLEDYTVPVEEYQKFLSRDVYLPLAFFPENQAKIERLKAFFADEAAHGRKQILLDPGKLDEYMKNVGVKAIYKSFEALRKNIEHPARELADKSRHAKQEAARKKRLEAKGLPFVPRDYQPIPFKPDRLPRLHGESQKDCLRDLFRIMQGFEHKPKPKDNQNLHLDEDYEAFEVERLCLIDRSDKLPSAMIDFRRQYIASQILLDPQAYLFPVMGLMEAASFYVFNDQDADIQAIGDEEVAADIATDNFHREVRERLSTLDRIAFSIDPILLTWPSLNLADPKRKKEALVAYSLDQYMRRGNIKKGGTEHLHAPAHGDLPIPISSSVVGDPGYHSLDQNRAIEADKYREARDFPALETETGTEYTLRSLVVADERFAFEIPKQIAAPTTLTQIHRFLKNSMRNLQDLEKDLIQRRIAQGLFLPGVIASASFPDLVALSQDLNALIKKTVKEERVFTTSFLLFLLNQLNKHSLHHFKMAVPQETNYKAFMAEAVNHKHHTHYATLCLFYLDAFADSPETNAQQYIEAYDEVVFAGPTIALTLLQETLLPWIQEEILPELEGEIRERNLVARGNKALLLPGNLVHTPLYHALFGKSNFRAEKTASDGGNRVCYTWKAGTYQVEAFHNEQGNQTSFYLLIDGKKYRHLSVSPLSDRHFGKTLTHHGIWEREDKPSEALLIPSLIQDAKPEELLSLSVDAERKTITSAKTADGQTLYFDDKLQIIPHIGCVHESDILLLKDFLSVSQIRFLHAPVHLVKDGEGNWVPKTGEPGWKLWTEDTAPLVKDLPCYKEFLLPFIHKEKGKEFLLFPHKMTKEGAFLKKPHNEETTAFLKIGIDKEQKMSGSHASFLYMAYVYFMRGEIGKALLFLNACKESGEYRPSESAIFKKIAGWFLEAPCPTNKALAFQLKLELAIREIQREQYHLPEFTPGEAYSYHEHLSHILSLHKKYEEIEEILLEDLHLTPAEKKAYKLLEKESVLENITPPKTLSAPLSKESLFTPVLGPQALHPEFVTHLAIFAEAPPTLKEKEKANKETILLTIRKKKITMSEDILKNFWFLWFAIETYHLTEADLPFLFIPMPDDLTDLKHKRIIDEACRLLLMQIQARVETPTEKNFKILGIQYKNLLPQAYPEGAYKWSFLANLLVQAHQAITSAAATYLLILTQKAIAHLCEKFHASREKEAVGQNEEKEAITKKQIEKHIGVIKDEIEALERAENKAPAASDPNKRVKVELQEYTLPNHLFDPADPAEKIRIEEKARKAIAFYNTKTKNPNTAAMTANENERIQKGIEEARDEMVKNAKEKRVIPKYRLGQLTKELEKARNGLHPEQLRAKILEEARKPEMARFFGVELFAASKEEYDEAILEKVLFRYEEGRLPFTKLVELVTEFLYSATGKQQLEKALSQIPELENFSIKEETAEYKDRSYRLYAQIRKAENRKRYCDVSGFKDSPKNRAILLHEYHDKIILTEEQLRLIDIMMDDTHPALEELRMGLGKTSVIFPLVAKLKARERKHQVVVLLTEELLLQCKDRIDKHAYIFEFDRNITLSPFQLSEEYLTLLRLKPKGRPIITTIERRAALRNKIVETIRNLKEHQNPQTDEEKKVVETLQIQLELMKRIYHLLRDKDKAINIGDEIDEICSINSEKNYADGSQTPIDVTIFEAEEWIFSALLDIPEYKKLLLGEFSADGKKLAEGDALSKLSDIKITEAAEKLTEKLYDTRPFWTWLNDGEETQEKRLVQEGINKEAFAKYLSGQLEELPEGLPNNPLKRTAAEKIDRLKHFFTKTLFTLSKKKHRVDYNLNGDGLSVVPLKLEQELPNTKYGQEAELTGFHFLHYLREGPSREGFERVIGSIEAEAARELESPWNDWLEAVGEDTVENPHARFDVLRKQENFPLRMQFLRFIMKTRPFIMMFDKQLVCHVQDVAFNSTIIGASGTVNRYALRNLFGNPEVISRKVTGETILKIDLEEKVTVFTDVLEQMAQVASNPEYNTIVNQSFSIPGKNTIDVIAYLRQKSRREYIFVHPTERVHYIWRSYADKPVPFNKYKDIIDPDNCFFYYAPIDTRGVDFIIPLGKLAAVFVGPTTTLTQKEQAEWRLRALGAGHTPRYYIQKEHADRIEADEIKAKHLVADVRDQTISEESMQNFKAASFTPIAILRNEVSEVLFAIGSNRSAKQEYNLLHSCEEVFFQSKRMIELNDYMPSKPVEILTRLQQIYDGAIEKILRYMRKPNLCPEIEEAYQKAIEKILEAKAKLGDTDKKYLKKEMAYASSESGEEIQIQQQQQEQQEQTEQVKLNTIARMKGDKRGKRSYYDFPIEAVIKRYLQNVMIDETFILPDFQFSQDYQLLHNEAISTGTPMGYFLFAFNEQNDETRSALTSANDLHIHRKQAGDNPNHYTYTETYYEQVPNPRYSIQPVYSAYGYYTYEPQFINEERQKTWHVSFHMIQNGTADIRHLEGRFEDRNPFVLAAAKAKLLQGFTAYSDEEKAKLHYWFATESAENRRKIKAYLAKRHAPDPLLKLLEQWSQRPVSASAVPASA